MIHCLALTKKDFYILVDVNSPEYKSRLLLNENDVPDDLKFTYNQRGMDFNKNLNLKGKFCYHPFNTITVDGYGDVYVCICQAWLPISVGKIYEFNSLREMVTNPRAREIQASILDGSYKYCDHNNCGLIHNNSLSNRVDHKTDTVNWINFALDSSCNLTCPSCRRDFTFLSNGPDFDKRMALSDHMVKLIEKHDHPLKFTLSGDGDPFASLIYRNMLNKLNLKGKKGFEIEIVTNGILVKDHWDKMSGVHDHVVRFKISFDAGTESTYNITRRGGSWNKLIESSRYIVKWKQKNYSQMSLAANFVVQQSNYKEMNTFVDLCTDLGFDEILFQKITDWGTFDNYDSHAVWKDTHPEYKEFLKVLHSPGLNSKKVNLTNLNELKNATK